MPKETILCGRNKDRKLVLHPEKHCYVLWKKRPEHWPAKTCKQWTQTGHTVQFHTCKITGKALYRIYDINGLSTAQFGSLNALSNLC